MRSGFRPGRDRRRWPRTPPLRIGLTGSIGMGKSTVAAMFADLGIPVFDADQCAHQLTRTDGVALPAILSAFPEVAGPDGLDRRMLADIVFEDRWALSRLEAILHPAVAREERRFHRRCALAGHTVALSDIPLLFETGAEARFDNVVVVSAAQPVWRSRMRRRSGMTPEKLSGIVQRQWSDRAKRAAADYCVRTGLDLGATRKSVAHVLSMIRDRTVNRRLCS